MTYILVAGGAGYIGSHACKALRQAGYTPVCYDNLSTGWAESVKYGPLEHGDLRDTSRLDAVLEQYNPTAVMHFAACSQVGESMTDPGKYWDNNVTGSLRLIESAVRAGVDKFVFSSTCATYGEHDNVVLDETTPQHPINAYGASKQAVEMILRDFGQAHGLGHVIFRYFNVAGADQEAEIGEFHQPETHLIPLILDAVSGKRSSISIHGTDYPTPDGTCIRDYVHVMDLVEAHILGLDWLTRGQPSTVFNLGTGSGFSVREVIDNVRRVTNRPLIVNEGPRRPGDCARLVSGSTRAERDLGWRATRSTMDTMVADAWRWHKKDGYSR